MVCVFHRLYLSLPKTKHMAERFIITKSELKENHWVCTDTQNLIICTFEDHKFNDTQEFKLLEDFNPNEYKELARMAREMGDWLSENHYNKVF